MREAFSIQMIDSILISNTVLIPRVILPGYEGLAWYTDLNDSKNNNILRYPFPSGIKKR